MSHVNMAHNMAGNYQPFENGLKALPSSKLI